MSVAMPVHLVRRLAVVTAACLLLQFGPDCRPPVRADDPAQKAHESAVLDRIFANWKARHDRVHSLHFTWDSRTTHKKGSIDFTSTTTPRPVLKQDQVIEQFGVQLWIEGDDRLCLVLTPNFKVPQAKPKDSHRVVCRRVIVGKTVSTLFASPWWETGEPRANAFASYATVYPCMPDYEIFRSELPPLFLTFRAQTPLQPWSKAEFHIVDENANIDNSRYVKLRRVVEQRGINDAKHEETYWVSPARDDAIVHWMIQIPPARECEGSIKYKNDPTYGWIPSEWTYEMTGILLEELKLTSYRLNEKIDPAIFSHEFPVGTPVEEFTDLNSPEKTRRYVVQQDGSKRSISYEEFRRLAGLGQPARNAVPAKPQAK
jgi:hypothetical protein